MFIFFFQAEDGIRDADVTGVQTCALPICICNAVGVQKNLCIDVPGTSANGLDEAGGRAKEAFLVGIEYCHKRHLGKVQSRSEERRVGKECRSRWSPEQ